MTLLICFLFSIAESKRIEERGGYMFTQTSVPQNFNFSPWGTDKILSTSLKCVHAYSDYFVIMQYFRHFLASPTW
jgi:hypothetical protein